MLQSGVDCSVQVCTRGIAVRFCRGYVNDSGGVQCVTRFSKQQGVTEGAEQDRDTGGLRTCSG